MISFDVHVYSIEARPYKKTTYRVRWTVGGERYGETFVTKTLADSYRSKLVSAQRSGEGFDTSTGLPASMARSVEEVSFYNHCSEFAASEWPRLSAKGRISLIETLTRVVPVAVKDLPGRPGNDVLRAVLRVALNKGPRPGVVDDPEALAWLERASLPVSSVESLAAEVLDSLAINLDGSQASPTYFSRRRRVLHKACSVAVRRKRLARNPFAADTLPEGWTAPAKPDLAVDPRSIGDVALISHMLEACEAVGDRKWGHKEGRRWTAFYACMYYGMMRPSEVAALLVSGCDLPSEGWGRLTFADASPSAGKAYTDDGAVQETRGLKGRTKGRPTRKRPSRSVPVPPILVEMLGTHMVRWGRIEGRVFSSARGNRINASNWWQMWQKVRAASLSDEQLATPLMKRPYDLRHAGIVTRLMDGVPAATVAGWAGNSPEMIHRTYDHIIAGMDDIWIAKMDRTFRGRIGEGS